MEGLKWRIGNGSCVSVWKDNWVPECKQVQGEEEIKNACPDMRVSDLIDPNTLKWDHNLISCLFPPNIATKIFSIPLSLSQANDDRFWSSTNNGIFTVRSAYRLGAMEPQNLNATPGSGSDELWNKLWVLNTIPKLKHFLWRFGNESLAVWDRLRDRGVMNTSICCRCLQAPESTIHATILCQEAKKIWDLTPFASIINSAPLSSPSTFLLWSLNKFGGEELISILSILWVAWHCRNEKVMNNVDPHMTRVLLGFTKMATGFRQVVSKTSSMYVSSPRTLSFSHWHPPPENMVKINTDAAIFTGGGVGLGCAIRNHSGQLVAVLAKRLSVNWDPFIAELAAARMGVFLAWNLGLHDAVIECDSLEVIDALQHKKVYLNQAFHFLNDIRYVAPKFSSLLASHVKRGGNCVAHLTARLGPLNGDDLLYQNSFPQEILNVVDFDLMN